VEQLPAQICSGKKMMQGAKIEYTDLSSLLQAGAKPDLCD
jgi:hypothetical protein